MNFKTTIFLIVLLIIAGVTVYFVQKQPAPQEEQTQAKNLLSISQDDVTKVTLTPADGQAMTLERIGGDWKIAQPVQTKADTFAAGDLVRELCELQSHAQVGMDVATGVDHPNDRVELTGKDGKTITLAFGEKSGVGNNLYVRVDDNPKVDVVSADVQTYLDKPISDYRDMSLVSATADKIDRVEIDGPGQKTTLERQGSKWEIISPNHWPAEASAMDDLLSSLTSLRAAGFADKPLPAATYQFNDPQLVVKYWTKSAASTQPAEEKIVFGRYENILKQNIFAEADGSVVKLSAYSMDSLNKTPLDLRDRTVVDIDSAKVEKIELKRDLPAATQPTSRPASMVDLVIARNTTPKAATQPTGAPAKSEPAWVFVNDKKDKVDEANVNDLLAILHPLHAEKYRAKLPTTLPADRFDLKITAAGKTDEFTFYATPANDSNAIAVYGGAIFEVPVTLIDHLKLDFGWPSK